MTVSSSPSQPHKTWRRLALAVWVLVALAFLAFYLVDLSLDYGQLLLPCQGEGCNYLAISPAELSVLESWGLSSRFYAVIMTGVTLVSVALFWLLAGLILWRQQDFRTGLAVAALFNPLRARIQKLIDRRFYRQKCDQEKVLSAFSSTLRDEVDLERLQNSIVAVVDETMQPASLSLWLRDAQSSEITRPVRRPNTEA